MEKFLKGQVAWLAQQADATPAAIKAAASRNGGLASATVEWPYCLKQLRDGSVLALNRQYKPLGLHPNTCGWVDYESHPSAVRLQITWDELAALLGYTFQAYTPDTIYLYDGNNAPIDSFHGFVKRNWEPYRRKLAILSELEISPRGTTTPAMVPTAAGSWNDV